MGGRLLRGLRHDGHRLLLHAAGPGPPAQLAAEAALLSATIFLAGGIIGTCHHLYFSGTPTVALAWGSVFSALEVVPLVLVGYEAWTTCGCRRRTAWVRKYKWPIYFFVAVAFWNMVGAGLFGFMINPPIALYYMQGLNTTPLHGHAALFGVYGMLGIGLMLVCLRATACRTASGRKAAQVRVLGMNVGLMAMCVLSLLPVGLMQTGPRWSTATGTPAAGVPAAKASCRRCAGCGCRATRCSPSARSPSWFSSSAWASDTPSRTKGSRRPGLRTGRV